MVVLEETESEIKIASLSLSDVETPRLSGVTSRDIVLAGPPKDLVKVQEKVRCLATNKQAKRDARRAERAMKLEAWKERKEAKRTARAAWRENRRAVRA